MGAHEEQPAEAAAELSGAARDLALASRRFDDGSEVYGVLGELQISLIDLHQTLQQLAQVHTSNQHLARDDSRDPDAGHAYAREAGNFLAQSAQALDTATTAFMRGFAASGHIAWEPGSTLTATVPDALATVLAARADHVETESTATPPPSRDVPPQR
ncbi:MAG: hypothetical protein ACTIC1_16100 [Brevibacterium sp.]|uniref:hypothetical protein n=2 Tax=Actinomycetes TaxID=1760 RepID=UPI003F92D9B0